MANPDARIPICECGEPLVPLPAEVFAFESPHPYWRLGAPYGNRSPYWLRQSVLAGLLEARADLKRRYPRWTLQIFDAYRPLAVQQFMVEQAFAAAARAQGISPEAASPAQREALWARVREIWAPPSIDPATPPPHSTGAAIDLTVVDGDGHPLDMGSAIDELSPRSRPGHYDGSPSEPGRRYAAQRQLLHEVMLAGGFRRHPREWWHFSYGDRMWAQQRQREAPQQAWVAYYGRAESPSG
ncbi:MAG: D-alanyl-D-alanine dipeptidase [Cyanobacteria bacterium QS_8_64_29]|nr:MAG: D-alanyl-D-alanine dipeptidase [Cyanobacteria bacterium QS_8_64_29]